MMQQRKTMEDIIFPKSMEGEPVLNGVENNQNPMGDGTDSMAAGLPGRYKSSFIHHIIESKDAAEECLEQHKTNVQAIQKMYKGEYLDRELQNEDKRYSEKKEDICNSIKHYHDMEIERLTLEKKNAMFQAHESILALLEGQKDILTPEELQDIVDKYKDNSLIQRRVKAIAEEKMVYLNYYPDADEKMRAVNEMAEAFTNWIRCDNLGMETAIYIKMAVGEYDNMLGSDRSAGNKF